MISKDELTYLYITENLDADDVATHLGCHKSTVYNYLKKYNIKKDDKNIWLARLLKSGHRHVGNYIYQSLKSPAGEVRLNLKQLKYALYLDSNDDVESWDFKLIKIPYMDLIDNKMKMFFIDFSVQSYIGDWWVELKKHNSMRPLTKRLYAMHAASNAGIKFRGLYDYELDEMERLYKSNYRHSMIKYIG